MSDNPPWETAFKNSQFPYNRNLQDFLFTSLRTPLKDRHLAPVYIELGGPQIGEVTCGDSPRLSRKRDHIKMRYYIDRRVTPPKRVTSPTRWSPTTM